MTKLNFSVTKKLICSLILGAGITSGYALSDLTYSIQSISDGDIVIIAENNTVQRIVVNKIAIKNSDDADCLISKDFIIEPHGAAIMRSFNQYKCFGLDNRLTLDSADFKTEDQKIGNVKADMRLQTYYTRGFQPDPYSMDKVFSLYFK